MLLTGLLTAFWVDTSLAASLVLDTRNHYEVLGLSKTASVEEIKSQYKIAAFKAHPDRPEGSHDEMQKVNAARDVLLSVSEKAAYDAKLAGGSDAAESDSQWSDGSDEWTDDWGRVKPASQLYETAIKSAKESVLSLTFPPRQSSLDSATDSIQKAHGELKKGNSKRFALLLKDIPFELQHHVHNYLPDLITKVEQDIAQAESVIIAYEAVLKANESIPLFNSEEAESIEAAEKAVDKAMKAADQMIRRKKNIGGVVHQTAHEVTKVIDSIDSQIDRLATQLFEKKFPDELVYTLSVDKQLSPSLYKQFESDRILYFQAFRDLDLAVSKAKNNQFEEAQNRILKHLLRSKSDSHIVVHLLARFERIVSAQLLKTIKLLADKSDERAEHVFTITEQYLSRIEAGKGKYSSKNGKAIKDTLTDTNAMIKRMQFLLSEASRRNGDYSFIAQKISHLGQKFSDFESDTLRALEKHEEIRRQLRAAKKAEDANS